MIKYVALVFCYLVITGCATYPLTYERTDDSEGRVYMFYELDGTKASTNFVLDEPDIEQGLKIAKAECKKIGFNTAKHSENKRRCTSQGVTINPILGPGCDYWKITSVYQCYR